MPVECQPCGRDRDKYQAESGVLCTTRYEASANDPRYLGTDWPMKSRKDYVGQRSVGPFWRSSNTSLTLPFTQLQQANIADAEKCIVVEVSSSTSGTSRSRRLGTLRGAGSNQSLQSLGVRQSQHASPHSPIADHQSSKVLSANWFLTNHEVHIMRRFKWSKA